MALETAHETLEAQALTEDPVLAPVVVARQPADQGWIWYVTALSVVLGIMLALAVRTTSHMNSAGFPASRFGISSAVFGAYKEQSERQQAQIEELNKKLRNYENSIDERIKSVEGLKKQFIEFKAAAGLAPVIGPGLKIQLRDSPKPPLPNLPPEELASYMVHDHDLNGLLSELKSSGCEAIAIAGADGKEFQRIVAMSSARCVGPTAVVNGVSLAAPYTILAIGNAKNLRRALEMPSGFIQTRGLDVLQMIVIEEDQHLVLPEYSGSFGLKHARPTPANE
jgi:uncharacterized protein YlxW (UPF0749 family)